MNRRQRKRLEESQARMMQVFSPGSKPPKEKFVPIPEYCSQQGGAGDEGMRAKLDDDLERLCRYHDCTREHLLRMFLVICYRVVKEVPLGYESIMGGLDSFRGSESVEMVLPSHRSCLAYLVGLIPEAPDEDAVREIYAQREDPAREALQARLDELKKEGKI